MKKIVQFVKESYAELRKVVWPSREDVIGSVKVVLISRLFCPCFGVGGRVASSGHPGHFLIKVEHVNRMVCPSYVFGIRK